ncbi:MAG: tyrosine--tRNA ligase [Planctomycetes bacterium]|nr:tyrosine--tRNA ligase [Planctomycetota bacterium]
MVDANLHTNLLARGLIHQVTKREDPSFEELLQGGPTVVYAGFDPTGDSLHIGHLVPLLGLRRFQLAGHKVIALAGGATGMVGDPSGRSSERNLLTAEVLEHNKAAIKTQLSAFLDFEGDNPAVLVDNLDWTAEVSLLDFLRDVGKHARVNVMIKRDSVRDRLERDGDGLSFTEFSYSLLQANDFLALHRSHACQIQIGGSDQWGNITAGVDLARRSDDAVLFGMTVPLLTRSDGSKFGKTAGGETLWLDPAQTSPFEFRQFWVNQADADMGRLLRFFSFQSMAEIEALEAQAAEAPHLRLAQKSLAREMTTLVHGEATADEVERAAAVLFDPKGDLREVPVEILANFPGAKQVTLKRARLEAGVPWLDLVVEVVWAGANKRGQARKDIQNNAMALNGTKWADPEASVTASELLHDRFLVIRKGKKNQFLVEVA